MPAGARQGAARRAPFEAPAAETAATPPGWTYNPSAWSERIPILIVAALGVLVAAYLALYQMGIVRSVWEPFFGEGSRRVLQSWLSRIFPVSDATLGAFAYLLDVVTGAIGGPGRWRTMPWMVILFGIAVGPLGLVSVLLVIAQPVVLDAWCTLCLLSAVLSLVMIGPAMDEVLASLQHVKRAATTNGSAWDAFWGRGAREER